MRGSFGTITMFMHTVDRGVCVCGGDKCVCVHQGLPGAFFWQQKHAGAADSFSAA